jgi:hypothetical protein
MEKDWVDAKLVKAFAYPDPEQGLRNAAPRRPARQENLPDAQTLKEAMRADRLRGLDQFASCLCDQLAGRGARRPRHLPPASGGQ